ncbi:MAG TPA: hypothetical protein VFL96_16535, partial [Acidobacteriaceae bacterium]|nr:hypothetical protein [Acidobacteriaceae bacterium]
KEMGDALAHLLDRTRLPPAYRAIWRLRLKASYLYAEAGLMDEALRQAEKAFSGGTSDPQVAVYIAGMLLDRGDFKGANRMLDAARRKILKGDIQGAKIIAGYRKAVREAEREEGASGLD